MIRRWLARLSAQGGDSAPQEVKGLVREGDAAFLRDDFPAAESSYRKAIGQAPKLASAHLGLGAALRVMGRLDEAISALHDALKIDDGLSGAHELLAACHLAQGDMVRAEPHLRRAIKLKPAAESNYLDLGAILVNQRRYQEAWSIVQQGIGVDPSFADLQLFLANLYYETGQFEQAAVAYRDALKLNPGQLLALYNLGLALLKTNEFEPAGDVFRRALELRPDWADAHNNLGYVYHRMGRLADAQASFARALAIDPRLAQAHLNAGELAMARGEAVQAVEHYGHAIAIDPDMADAHLGLGTVLVASGRQDEAMRHLEHCLEIVPGKVEALLQLAGLHSVRSEYRQALARYREIVTADPYHIEALLGIAVSSQCLTEYHYVLLTATEFTEAVAACRTVIACEPGHLQARQALGSFLGQNGEFDAADEQFEAVLLRDPNNVDARHNLGVSMEARARVGQPSEKAALLERALEHYTATLAAAPHHIDAMMGVASIHGMQLRTAEAAAAYERILQIDPGYTPAEMSYAMLKLQVGDFAVGWRHFECRLRLGSKWTRIRFQSDKPQWSKDVDLAGKTIILYYEQGLGDSLQFVRYAGLIAGLGAKVLVKSQPPLTKLFASCPGVHAVFDGDEVPEHDFHFPILSLALAFDTGLATIPAAIPYLQAAPARIEHWSRKFGSDVNLRVGLVWAGDSTLQGDNMRSLHFDHLRSLLEVPGVTFYSMQVGKAAAAQLAVAPQVVDFTEELFDFQETAALAANLDLVISVDTSSAHLVGAIGKPVWLLNRFNTCWRWLLERSDSPWYPTMRIFRQSRLGDWDSVVAEVKLALEAKVARRLDA